MTRLSQMFPFLPGPRNVKFRFLAYKRTVRGGLLRSEGIAPAQPETRRYTPCHRKPTSKNVVSTARAGTLHTGRHIRFDLAPSHSLVQAAPTKASVSRASTPRTHQRCRPCQCPSAGYAGDRSRGGTCYAAMCGISTASERLCS